MAVSSYEKEGKTFWRVYLNLRSKNNPTIRVQKLVVGIESEKAAVSEEKKILRLLTEEISRLEGYGLTWEAVVDRWEMMMRESHLRKLDPVTLRDHLAMITRWTETWLKKPASLLNRADGRAIFDRMEEAGKSRSFQMKVKSTINQIYDWGIQERLIRGVSETPVAGVQLKKEKEEKLPEILNLDQIRTLLSHAKNLEHKWYPIWAMAILTGMRNGELHALLWSDVDMDGNIIVMSKSYNTRSRTVKCPKAGYWRNVPISPELKELLISLKSQMGNQPHVLPRFRDWDKGEQARVLRTFCKGIGLPSIKFHTLRACFGTQLLAHDIAPARVMKIAGWKDLKTMQRYIRLAGVDERGATDCLKVLPTDADAMNKIVSLLDFKGKNGNG